jgi:hypothetical protein
MVVHVAHVQSASNLHAAAAAGGCLGVLLYHSRSVHTALMSYVRIRTVLKPAGSQQAAMHMCSRMLLCRQQLNGSGMVGAGIIGRQNGKAGRGTV